MEFPTITTGHPIYTPKPLENNMSFLKPLLLLICCSLAFNAISKEISGTEMEEMAKRIFDLRRYNVNELSNEQKIAELDGYKATIEQAIEQSPNNPQLQWLNGANTLAYKYSTDRKELYANDKERWKEITHQKDRAYQTALELDKSHEPHLTAGMLHNMKGTGSSEIVVYVIKRLLKETELERFPEVEMRGQMNSHLLKLERFDEIYENLDYLDQFFPDYADLNEGRRSRVTKKINKLIAKSQVKEDAKKAVIMPKPKTVVAKLIKEKLTKIEPKQTPIPKTHPSALPKIDNSTNWPLGILILVLILSGAYLIRRYKKGD